MKRDTSAVAVETRRKGKGKNVIRIMPVAIASVLVISGLLTGCGSGGGGADPGSDEPRNSQVVIAAVREIGAVSRSPSILERDCGFSALFQGQSVWLFGDTVLETPNANDSSMISSSLSCTFDIDAGDGIEGFSEMVDWVGAPATFFPLTEDELAFNQRHAGESCEEEPCNTAWHIWPGTILVDEEKDWAYVFYLKVLVEQGFFNFEHVGHSMAVWKDISQPPERAVFNQVESHPTLLFGETGGPGFSSAALVLDKEAFIYGCELAENPLTKPCHVARVPLADILDMSAWSFYSGDGKWSPEREESKEIFSGSEMMSVFFNPYINRFVAIYSKHLGASAMLRTAVRPEGPWSEPMEIFSVDAPDNPYGWVYDFLAHPEFSQDNGRVIFITYSKKIAHQLSELRLVAVHLEMSE